MITRTRVFKILTVFSFAVLVLGCASQALAVPTMELVLDDGLGDVVTIDVSGGVATVTNGACPNGCTVTAVTTGDHKRLVALGTLGQLKIHTTGRGGHSLPEYFAGRVFAAI